MRIGLADDLQTVPADPRRRTQLDGLALVMNSAERTHGRCREAWVPSLLEPWGIPCVGSGSGTQTLVLDQIMTKRLAMVAGVRS